MATPNRYKFPWRRLKPFKRKNRRYGRNEICPCGKTVLKFKKCCLPKFEAKERSRLMQIKAIAKRIFDRMNSRYDEIER